ncbi:hypothetical protein FRC12_000811 [Ceratobasidium sp. 428]|nr:hypothetical protein FRC12_000811 [Ceratobasidium sp. 428]
MQSNYIKLLSERSLGVTVDLFIWVQWNMEQTSSIGDTREDCLDKLVSILAPLAPRTRQLELLSDVYSGSELQPILASFIKLCTSSLLEVFTVRACHKPSQNAELFNWSQLQSTDPPTTHQIDTFIRPVRVLELRDAYIPWDSHLYRGLTELFVHLSGSAHPISQDQLLQILLVCPALKVLSFRNIYTSSSSEVPNELEPVHLNQLQRLELISSRPERLTCLLRAISAKSQSLTVRLSLVGNDSEFVQQLHTFFDRHAAITVLHVRPKVKTAWFSPLSNSLHRLSKLTLEACDFADADLAMFVRTEHFNNGSVPWPWLYELRLIDCIVDIELLECLATSPFIEKIRLIHSKVREPDSGRFVPVKRSMFTPVYGGSHVVITIFND